MWLSASALNVLPMFSLSHCKGWHFLNADPFIHPCEPVPITRLELKGCTGVWGKLPVEILSKMNGQARQAALSWKEARDVAP